MYPLRSIVVLYMLYTSILGLTGYSAFMSLFDGVAGFVPIGLILSRFFGIYGIVLSFPTDSFLLVLLMVLINHHLVKEYPDRFADVLLVEKMRPEVHLMDISVSDKNEDISALSSEARDFCLKYGASHRNAGMIALCTEEMAVYTRQHAKKGDWINLMLKTDGKQAILDFRSLGDPFDLGKFGEGDIEENFRVLRSIAPEYTYSYSLGMNSTRFVFPLA
jgi:hypothetical protein